jgi:SAM-dependent methyltransferase
VGVRPADNGKPHQAKTEPLAVAVVNQRHPITQSVTHFLHHGRLAQVKLARSADVLATALPSGRKLKGEPRPVVWTVERQGSRVWVCLLDLETGESTGLVASLVRRALEWSRGKWVTFKLDPKRNVRWLAETLGPGDVGLLPGRKAASGFFRGRQIAPFMTHHGAEWLVRPDREETEQPEKVLDSLNLRPGDTVADLGCGNGYFTLRMAKRVGAQGRVFGVDIQQEMLTLLVERARAADITNVEPVLARENDPRLPDESIDLVLMVDAYHELAHPTEVLRHVLRALKEKGRVVLVEYRGEDPSVPIKPLHKMTERQARAELEAMGFLWLETKSFLPMQHVLIFEKGKRE